MATDQPDSSADARSGTSPEGAPLNIPPASFSSLVQMLATQSMAALGLIAGPDGKTHKEPAIAKHFIDLLSVLETKCQGNLDASEAKMLESLLHDLRLTFIQSTK